LKVEAAELGNEVLLEKLRSIDPETAARLHPNDQKRIIRALEVHALTGQPISHFHSTAGRAEVSHHVRPVRSDVEPGRALRAHRSAG